MPIPLYTPARIHVITDRPLYEPGNTVRFRAVVLRARDLAPLDERPGMWVVTDPNGEVLLEEKAPAGDWGVVAGTFPLDKGAPTGTWKVAWRSADASDEVAFTVEPFTLPRFRVEAAADQAVLPGRRHAGDQRRRALQLGRAGRRGRSSTSSGTSRATWPPPLEWQEKLLPKQGGDGRERPVRARAAEDPGGSAGQGDARRADLGGRSGRRSRRAAPPACCSARTASTRRR